MWPKSPCQVIFGSHSIKTKDIELKFAINNTEIMRKTCVKFEVGRFPPYRSVPVYKKALFSAKFFLEFFEKNFLEFHSGNSATP